MLPAAITKALQSLARSPAGLAVTVVAVLAVWWLMTQRKAAGSGGSNVLRPVRASERSMNKRGLAFQSLVIQEVEKLSPDTQRFRVALPSPSATLGKRGHMSIQATIDGQRVVRPYTPITPPWQAGYFDLVIKRYDYGALTPHLFKLEVGDEVSVRGPFGGLKYTPNEFRRILLLGAGSGLTPLLQVIRIALAEADDETSFLLLYQNRNEDDIILHKHLMELAAENSRLTVKFFCSRAPAAWQNPALGNYSGYISQETVSECVTGGARAGAGGPAASASDTKAVVCGPSGFNKAMKELLASSGIENVRLL